MMATRSSFKGYQCASIISGGWQLSAGHHADFDQTAALDSMRKGLERGLTSLDMGDIYTGVELLAGEFLQTLNQHLNDCENSATSNSAKVEIHTKFVPDLELIRSDRVGQELVDAFVHRSCNRLGLKQLSLVQFHWWDFEKPGYVHAAKLLDQSSQVANLGVTNFDAKHMKELLDAGVNVIANQVQYSVLDRRPEKALVSLCLETKVMLLPYGVLAGGFLTDQWLGREDPVGLLTMGNLSDFSKLPTRSHTKYYLMIRESGGWDRFQRLLRILRTIADRHQPNTTIAAIAAAWVLQCPSVGSIILGARTSHHLNSTMSVMNIKLTQQDLNEIDAHEVDAEDLGPVYELERVESSLHAAIMRYNLGRYAGDIHRTEVINRINNLKLRVTNQSNSTSRMAVAGMMTDKELAANLLCEIRSMLAINADGDLTELRKAYGVAAALTDTASTTAFNTLLLTAKSSGKTDDDSQKRLSRELITSGMEQFRRGDLEAALIDFDNAINANNSVALMSWQRGLTLFYLNRYAEAAAQFYKDVANNSADSEEAIWHLLSLVKGGQSVLEARHVMLTVETDPRPMLQSALDLFKGGITLTEFLQTISVATASSTTGHDAFYGKFYVGLYLDMVGERDQALQHITEALDGEYSTSNDFMLDVARVHRSRLLQSS